MKQVVILGSTGSIGVQALDVISNYPDRFSVVGLAANHSVELIEKQARAFGVKYVCLTEEKAAADLKVRLADTDIKVTAGLTGLCQLAGCRESDIVLNAVVGMVGLTPTLAALEAGKDVALANKETLVAGGKLVCDLARKKGCKLLPVDSEHSAIFQCLQDVHSAKRLKKIILTASGGPFFGKTRRELEGVTKADALKHPNWDMGAKITIDSATLMNKGLELIEACWLFDKTPKEVEIVVHRQSIVHSLVEFEDHSVLAQLGLPDMRIPIQYALTYPDRLPSPVPALSLTQCGSLTFERPDTETFTCLGTCIAAANKGGLAPCTVNSAGEEAVALFLKDKISFLQIGQLAATAMHSLPHKNVYSLEDVLARDWEARAFVRSQI